MLSSTSYSNDRPNLDILTFDTCVINCESTRNSADHYSYLSSSLGSSYGSSDSECAGSWSDTSLLGVHSPLESLDNIRLTCIKENDFQRNGIDSDLDEIDVYIALRRQRSDSLSSDPSEHSTSPTPNDGSSVKSSASSSSGVICGSASQHKIVPKKKGNTVCVFCKNNGETLSVYGNHVLKDDCGRVTCPILRRYTCPKCGASGDDAHTIKYCPLSSTPLNTVMISAPITNGTGPSAGMSLLNGTCFASILGKPM